jgi:hypothetical protein
LDVGIELLFCLETPSDAHIFPLAREPL